MHQDNEPFYQPNQDMIHITKPSHQPISSVVVVVVVDVTTSVVVGFSSVVVGFCLGARDVSTIVEGLNDLVVTVSGVVVDMVVVAMAFVVVGTVVVVGTGVVVVGTGVVVGMGVVVVGAAVVGKSEQSPK